MSTLASEVKSIISEICGLSAPQDDREKLCDLGFNDNMCSDLAEELDKYVKDRNAVACVDDNEITSGMTIKATIDLVSKKLGL